MGEHVGEEWEQNVKCGKLLIDGCISVLGNLSAKTDKSGSYPVMSKTPAYRTIH